jgi:Tfp pilus assembly protein PilE
MEAIPKVLEPKSGTLRAGFVLAEVLVVSIIVAALAVVAIPIYSGMIKSQRRDVARNIAQTAALSANVYYRKYGLDPNCSTSATCITQLSLFMPDPSKYTVVISGTNIVITDISKGNSDSVQATAGFH